MPLVEKRYAEALIRIGIEQNNLDQLKQDLGDVKKIVSSSKELCGVLASPSFKSKDKKEAVKVIFANSISDTMMKFLCLLIDKGRISQVSEIFSQYTLLLDEIKKCLNIQVVTAETIEDSLLNQIGEKLRNKYGSNEVKIDHSIDPSIIGGIIVRVGDKLIDGSLKGKIETLAEQLAV
jgi:F-type H+-transporting ATPase subunit delta